MDLFEEVQDNLQPLSARMRPRFLGEFVGQGHIVGDNSLLARAIRADKLGSCIFYGPAGVGKTSLASVVANCSNGRIEYLNAVSSGVADAKAVIQRAKDNKGLYGKKTYLMLDECHRWSKAQSDSVLAAIEDGSIVFIGCTTENPFVAMTRAIVSRCRIFEFVKLSDDDILKALRRAIDDKDRGLGQYLIRIDDDAIRHIAWAANGDMRTAYNAIELATITTPIDDSGYIHIDRTVAEQSIQKKALSIDETIFYDMLSAFCKSLRGSAPDAALFWAFRLLEAGLDPLIIFRRLIAHSSEDVGLADSQALVVVTSSLLAYERIGMPEGRLPLVQAIIYVCKAPKSNSVVVARDRVVEDVRNNAGSTVPYYLRDKNYPSVLDTQEVYKYPHDYGGYVEQEYMPTETVGHVYYEPNSRDK